MFTYQVKISVYKFSVVLNDKARPHAENFKGSK